jgi:hypothetical protein
MCDSVDNFVVALSQAPLLRHVGEPIEDSSMIQVHSWAEALNSCRAQAWDDFLIDRHNENAHAKNLDKQLGRSYSALVRQIRPILDAAFQGAASAIGLTQKETDSVMRYALWIMLRACDEIAHCSHYHRHWHLEVSHWLLEGHFICGYEGDWPEGGEPNGKLVIF